jgi:RNA polymerase sigma factor (sigma-70 family)
VETHPGSVEVVDASRPHAHGEGLDLESIYAEHFRFVWVNLARLGVAPAAMEDALQDVFVVVHRQLSGFAGRSQLRTWLFGIVRRIAHRHRRSDARADRKLRVLAEQVDAPAGIEDELHRRELRVLVARALDELDEDKRAALVLHVFEELSGPELAATLRIPLDTAYSRVKAARRGLKLALARHGIAAEPERALASIDVEPPKEARHRIWPLVVARGGAESASVVATAVGSWKGLIAGVVLGLVGVTAIAPSGGREQPTPPAPRKSVERTATPVAAAIVPASLPVATPPVRAPAIAIAPNEQLPVARAELAHDVDAVPLAPMPGDAVLAEVRSMAAVKAALDGRDAADALRRLQAHAREFPRGQLAIELAGYRAIALCESGQRAAGRGEARVFGGRHPSSTLAPRVAAACDLAVEEISAAAMTDTARPGD